MTPNDNRREKSNVLNICNGTNTKRKNITHPRVWSNNLRWLICLNISAILNDIK
jgi:hypothetical protein